MRNTDFPLFDSQGRVERIGGIAEDVAEQKLAAEHQGVLLAELQHRVRNIMAMIRSVTARTGERAASVEDYASLMMGRLLALARVQAAEVLTLAVHELETNALKYGALSAPKGKVTVAWSMTMKRDTPWLVFDWTEEGAPAQPERAPNAPRRRGFGSELIEGRVPYELRGTQYGTIERLEKPVQLRDIVGVISRLVK